MGRYLCEYTFQMILGKHLYKQNICIPNVLMFDTNRREYEADFLYFSLKSRNLTEVEIKLDIRDFLNDFNKTRYHDNPDVMYLYYCIPTDMYELYKEEIDSKLGDAGLILIDSIDTDTIEGHFYEFGRFKKRAKKRKGVSALSDEQVMRYMRIGCMKWVSRG